MSKERSYTAVTTIQHPLTGDQLPRTLRVTDGTTLKEIFAWYRDGTDWTVTDLRIVENSQAINDK